MPKFGVTLDANYRRLAEQATDIRSSLRGAIHPPEKRATSRALFLIGCLTLALFGGAALGLLV